ncbi:uncharacterized protein K02A2.6-like [Mytilus trossulus]|uniref:uncharacterized protein K02A2.6-like n=1 Tax=Mytilus trossulus TaxID=6551 RepID=UPI00300726EA
MAEARPILSDVGLIPFFDVGNDINSLGQRWTRWLRSFNLYATGKGVVEAQQKKALLLHSAGMEVQDVYYTLVERDPGEHETVYEVTVEILNNHFTPQVNNSFHRNQFRAMEQKPQETIEQYITRLRQKVIYCNFGNVDEAICDQVIDKCSSKRLRRKLLERHNVTLHQLSETAQAMEAAEKQATSIEQPIESVNKVSTYANDTCSEPDYDNEDDDYAFTVHGNQGKVSKFTVNVGGIDVPVVIDSGATVNIIDRTLWEHLKKNKIKCESKTSSKNLYAYGSNKPLTIAGSFNTNVCVNDRCVSADFFVIEEDGQALLGHKTSIELGVLKIETNVNTVTDNVVKTNYTSKFPKVFSGVGKLVDFQLKIPIDKSIQPVIQPLRRIPYHLRGKLEEKLNELVEQDIIEAVNGPSQWTSPIVVVPKKNGDIRICVDMRRANLAVMRERYPIPTVDEVIQDLNQSKVFSKLDIKLAYHQIELTPESRQITCFMTHKGIFRYKRLMFGINCAPEMYNKVMSQVFQGLEGVRNIFDDVVVYGSTSNEHNERLDAVLQRLEERGLTLNIDKCKFNMANIEFMGHMLSEHGIGVSQSKVEAIVNARRPESVSEIRSFLGLVNFVGRFIPNLATVAEPLHRLLHKETKFQWGPEQNDSFEKLKKGLVDASNLSYFSLKAKTQVIVDASPVGLGAVLVQKQNDEYKVICYASRSLTTIERKYSQTEKEALGLVWACERFHMYLLGHDFELLTDHRPLEFIFSPKSKPCARVERWMLRMQPFKYVVKYIPGSQNIADSLSRLLVVPKNESKQGEINQAEEYIRFVASESTPNAVKIEDVDKMSLNDKELQNIRNCLLNGRWQDLLNKQYLTVKQELSSIGHIVLRGTRLIIPTELRNQILKLGHEGHPGIVLMKQRLRSKVWWPNMDKSIEEYCKSCYGCQLVANPEKPEPMIRTSLPSKPWEQISADFLGPLPSGEYLFTVVDYYSRWLEVTIMSKSTSADRVIDALDKMFTIHGLPISIATDNGPQFISDTFKTYLDQNGIVHRRITPLWPAANGEIERQNRSLLKRMRIANAEKKNLSTEIQTYLKMYRSTPHCTTGVSPAELLFNRTLRTKLPDIQIRSHDDTEVRDRDSQRKEKGKLYADTRRNATTNDLKAGDSVLVKQNRGNKLSTTFNPKPFTLLEKHGNSVVVQNDDGDTYKRNVTHIKRFIERKSSENQNVNSENVNSENQNVNS